MHPIFLHSWWRSSSTFLWSRLRSMPGVTAYYEPFHEAFATHLKPQLSKLVARQGTGANLFHADISDGYFTEFQGILDTATEFPVLAKPVVFDQFFLDADHPAPGQAAWVERLLDAAPTGDRVAFGCVRTLGRVSWLKAHFGGTHVMVWRDPWDQWGSINRLHGVFGNTYFRHAGLLVATRLRGSAKYSQLLPADIPAFRHPSLAHELQLAKSFDSAFTPMVRLQAFVATLVASLLMSGKAVDLVLDVGTIDRTRETSRLAGKALSRETGLKIDLSDFRYARHSRQGEALYQSALSTVLTRLSDADRVLLVETLDHLLSRAPLGSESLLSIRKLAETPENHG